MSIDKCSSRRSVMATLESQVLTTMSPSTGRLRNLGNQNGTTVLQFVLVASNANMTSVAESASPIADTSEFSQGSLEKSQWIVESSTNDD